MLKHHTDTIAAVATPIGEGGISVIRVSGLGAIDIVSKRIRGKTNLLDAMSHTAHFGRIVDESGVHLDEVVCTVFREPRSYTGEDTVEISCHGGVLVTKRILESLLRTGSRLAEPGEFTKRAFLNGKLDLSQAEAVADLIHAQSDRAHRASLEQLEGSLSRGIQQLRDQLVESIGLLELELDFIEDGLEFVDKSKVVTQTEKALERVNSLVDSYRLGRVYREGVKVVLTGAPNVGKSSLLNALLNENRAIVTDTPGTTRDVIEEALNIRGVSFKIIDTAGLRETRDPVEEEGVRRTRNQVSNADLVLFMVDGSRELSGEEIQFAGQLAREFKPGGTSVITVINKVDLNPAINGKFGGKIEAMFGGKGIKISALKGTGLEDLKNALLSTIFKDKAALGEGSATITNLRHYNALLRAKEGLALSLESLKEGKSGEFVAVDLRSALDNLGEIVGAVTTEDILNDIFSKFCIGK